MFDHRPVFLDFGIDKSNDFSKNGKKSVKNWFLDDPLLKMSTELCALQVYFNALCPNTNENVPVLAALRLSINQITANLIQLKNLKEKVALDLLAGTNDLLIAARVGEHAL
jgi:hypothetical protein